VCQVPVGTLVLARLPTDNVFVALKLEPTMATTVEIGLVATNERFDDEDPRWRDQVADLVDELRREAGSLHSRRTAIPGTKGALDNLILVLGSAGAFTAAVEIVRAWLARDKHRSVALTFTAPDGGTHTVHVSAENASSEAMTSFVSAASSMAAEW
jgi:exopolyphosphatase/pppGpp-phosphohydrolase